MKTISLVMILKNESKTILQAIESALPIVDEIVIGIDDKTTDDTNEVVCKYLSQNKNTLIQEFTFKDDFAAIRNKFIELTTSDYILILDGHEYFTEPSINYLKQLKENDMYNADVIDFNLLMSEDGSTILQQPRLFKNHIRYEYAIHNTITHIENRIAMPQITIVHNQPLERYKARKLQRSKMNIDGLLIKATSGDSRSMYYLATQFYELKEWEKAKVWYESYIKQSDFAQEKYQASLYLATCYKFLDKENKYFDTLMECFKRDSSRNEHIIAIGDYYYEKEMYKKAAHFYRMATSFKLPERFLVIEMIYYTWLPWYKLMLASLQVEDVDTTMECIKRGKQIAPYKHEWFDVEEKVRSKIFSIEKKKKGSLYFVDSIQSFITPILENLNDDYYIRMEQSFNPDNAYHADLIWCEWADENAISVGSYKKEGQVKVLRIHSYEAYSPLLNRIDFDAFDLIIFVANHVKNIVCEKFDIDHKSVVIPNGVDLDKFEIADDKQINNNIAYAGHFKAVKGIPIILEAARQIPEYNFHLAGKFMEPDLKRYMNINTPDNVTYYPWQTDLNKFYADKSYVISASIREGCPVAVLEAMACGLHPLLFKWEGADELIQAFPFASVSLLRANLIANHYARIPFNLRRNFIEKYYNQKDQLQTIKNLIDKFVITEKSKVA